MIMKMRNSVFLVARKFWISPILALIPVLGLATSLFVATAQALDLFPPNVPVVLGPSTIRPQTWDRGDPGTTSAEWIFATAPDPTTPLAPDGIDVPLNPGDYNGTDVTTGNPITGPVATPSEGLGIGAGGSGWLNTSDSDATITFTIPDWVDDNPIKYLQVQTLFTEPPGSTRNPDLSVTGYKDNSPIDANDDGLLTLGHLYSSSIPAGSLFTLSYYDLTPNPDYEDIVMTVPSGYTISEVVIDTISCPEPSSFALAGIGVIGLLGYVARRRTTKA